MVRVSLVSFGICLVAAGVFQPVCANAQTTTKVYYVGTCRPEKADFTTIEDAVTGVPSGSTIKVCPGTYPEQVTIRQPLTLQGMQSGNDASVIISAPPTAVTNLPSPLGQPVSAQLGILGTGPVNISGLTLDGTGFSIPGSDFVSASVAFINSTGAVDHIVSQNLQSYNNAEYGVVVATENEIPQTFSMTNSLIGGTPNTGVLLLGPDLSFDVENNFVILSTPLNSTGVQAQLAGGILSGNTFNLSNPGSRAIFVSHSATPVTISGNSINNVAYGIGIDNSTAATSITKNRISTTGTSIGTTIDGQLLTIQGNQILSATSGIDIDLGCQHNAPAISGNLFLGGEVGLNNVPSGVALQKSAGTFIDVPTIEVLCQ